MFDKLLSIREENELTQEELANIIGVSRSLISKWESNDSIIPLKHLNFYSNYFNVSLDYLTGISDIKHYENNNIIIIKDLNMVIIGKRIKKVRTDNSLSLRDLASILNTSPSTISAYENGKVLILTIFAYNIAIRFNTSLDWLCGKK